MAINRYVVASGRLPAGIDISAITEWVHDWLFKTAFGAVVFNNSNR